jgi:hypothetical protein
MEWITARRGRESGQMLVLFVLALGVLMGFVAMSIDVGMILHERRSAQNAADAAALAGVQELPGSPSAAVLAAQQWAAQNGFSSEDGATITVNTPYQGNPGAVEVIIEEETPFLFARALGLDSINVHARAVATRDGAGAYAIYAHGSACGEPREVDVSGSTLSADGDIHSNGDIKLTNGTTEVDGTVTYRCPPPNTGGSTTNISGGLNQASQTVNWPIYYAYSDFGPCTFSSSGDLQITQSDPQYWLNDDPGTNTLKPGVYCADGDIHLSGGTFFGNVTFVARNEVHFSGATFDFTPYRHDVVAFAEKSDPGCRVQNAGCDLDPAVHISSSTFTWEGILLATRYTVQISSSTASTDDSEGSVIGEFVKISGSTADIDAWTESEAGPPRLVE